MDPYLGVIPHVMPPKCFDSSDIDTSLRIGRVFASDHFFFLGRLSAGSGFSSGIRSLTFGSTSKSTKTRFGQVSPSGAKAIRSA